jgi:hypothetical protein
VVANGGTVSGSTLAAVSQFCRSIDAAGIRDRFFRLNPFLGAGLSAALVPLFRGPTRTGTQFGNATDTNNNFVSGDYTSDGLAGNGSTKFLQTGFATTSLGTNLAHISVSASGTETSAPAGTIVDAMGTYDGSTSESFYGIEWYTFGGNRGGFVGGFNSASIPPPFSATERHMLVSRESSTSLTLYRSGTSVATQSISVTYANNMREFYVFALNNAGTAQRFTASRMQCYSIGLSLTATQAQSFYAALNTLFVDVGR